MQRRAQEYCGSIFERPPDKEGAKDARLEKLLKEGQVGSMTEGACFRLGDIQMIRHTLQPRTTCGNDGVAADMPGDSHAAGLHWAVCFSGRLMSVPWRGSRTHIVGAFTDDCWGALHV